MASGRRWTAIDTATAATAKARTGASTPQPRVGDERGGDAGCDRHDREAERELHGAAQATTIVGAGRLGLGYHPPMRTWLAPALAVAAIAIACGDDRVVPPAAARGHRSDPAGRSDHRHRRHRLQLRLELRRRGRAPRPDQARPRHQRALRHRRVPALLRLLRRRRRDRAVLASAPPRRRRRRLRHPGGDADAELPADAPTRRRLSRQLRQGRRGSPAPDATRCAWPTASRSS
jgi:hypothetical protein